LEKVAKPGAHIPPKPKNRKRIAELVEEKRDFPTHGGYKEKQRQKGALFTFSPLAAHKQHAKLTKKSEENEAGGVGERN